MELSRQFTNFLEESRSKFIQLYLMAVSVKRTKIIQKRLTLWWNQIFLWCVIEIK